jgi:hypothetical protein
MLARDRIAPLLKDKVHKRWYGNVARPSLLFT